jgi:DNA-binding transcriptional ArsR family regulator
MSSTGAVETETPAEESSAPSPEQLDRIFAILRNHRRRLVLAYLREHDSTTQGDLARHIAAAENGISESAVTSTQRKRVYVSLYQAHLPKLDDFGAISFDRDRGTVERTDRTDELLRYLGRFEDEPRATTLSERQFGLSTVVLLGSALLVVFAGELGMVPADLSLGVAVLLSLVGMSAAVYDVRA